jgi:murein DD-endopeptidase MepM/ murein hydrolase activator NlpD
LDLRMTRFAKRPLGRNWIAAICLPAATVVVCAIAPGAEAASSNGGGSLYSGPPSISDITCRKGCVTGESQTQTQTQTAQTSGTIQVRKSGSLKVRGKNLAGVQKVMFTGSTTRSGDEFIVKPSSVSASSISVPVKGTAKSGYIKLIDDSGRKSKASRVQIKIMPASIPGNANGQGFIWPVTGPITGVFGENRGDHYHAGIDIATPSGTKIKAAASGKVNFVGSAGGYGNMVCITHGTLSSCYAHMSRFADVDEGSPVEQGGIIGYVGCTGNCTGPHVHFEIRQGSGPSAKPVDPMGYLPDKPSSSSSTTARSAGARPYEHTQMDYSLPVHSYDDH